jgi:hypothetical protein
VIRSVVEQNGTRWLCLQRSLAFHLENKSTLLITSYHIYGVEMKYCKKKDFTGHEGIQIGGGGEVDAKKDKLRCKRASLCAFVCVYV